MEGKKFIVISIESLFSYVPAFLLGPPLKDPKATPCIIKWSLLLSCSRWKRKVKIILEKLKRTHGNQNTGSTLALYLRPGEYGHTFPP